MSPSSSMDRTLIYRLMVQGKPSKGSPLFSLVGVGPGDPGLMTLRAAQRLLHADCVIAPKGQAHGASSALRIARGAVDLSGKEIVEIHFPMRPVRLDQEADPSLEAAWRKAASHVLARLQQGKRVVFPTLGDPSIYSTAYYLLSALRQEEGSFGQEFLLEMVPGVTAMSSCSCGVLTPLALGDDIMTVVPAAFEDGRISSILKEHDSVVLMKVHRRLDRLVPLIEAAGLLDKAILVERCGMEGQRIFHDIRDALGETLHYFSTIIVRKRDHVITRADDTAVMPKGARA